MTHQPVLLTLTLALAAAGTLPAQLLHSPASRTAFEGSSRTSFPLGRHNMRLQQLHDDVSFNLLPVVSGHAYRRDAIATNGTIASFLVDMEVQMSMALTTANNPSTTFASNRGANPVTVLPRTVVSFPSTSRPGTAPAPSFELFVPYATPFVRPAAGTLCVETVVYGNQAPSGADRNFNPLLDAHVLESDGTTKHLGYRYGAGCVAASQTRGYEGRFEFLRTPTDLLFTIDSRFGVPTADPLSPGLTALVLGSAAATTTTWPTLNNCSTFTTNDLVVNLPGNSDTAGDWDITYTGLDHMPVGFDIYLQLLSGNPLTGEFTLSDGTFITTPGVEAIPRQVARVAASTNRDATTGTVSFNVPVTMFF